MDTWMPNNGDPMNLQEIDVNIQDISPKEFSDYTLVDVREDDEVRAIPAQTHYIHLPCSRFMMENTVLNKDGHYLIFCAAGGRSHRVAEILREEGFTNVFSVNNGIGAVNAYLKQLPPGHEPKRV